MLKPVKKLFLGLIVLSSFSMLGACGSKEAPLIYSIYCPSPSVPILPKFIEEKFLDSRENIGILMLRDDIIRAFIGGLEETIICYKNTYKEENTE